MSQAGWLVLCLKVALIAGFISLAGWVVLYFQHTCRLV